MLRIINLKKYFGGVKAVDGCDIEVKERTITALIGPNGAGKSTVFNLVSGVLRSDSGKVIFGNKEITNLRIAKISNLGISRLFQKSNLFNNITVKGNLLLALDNEDTKFWKNLIGSNKKPKGKMGEKKPDFDKKGNAKIVIETEEMAYEVPLGNSGFHYIISKDIKGEKHILIK